MADYIPFIITGMGVIFSVFGFFVKQTIADLKQQISDVKKDNAELIKKVQELEKGERGFSSDLKHAIETMHDIKDMVMEKL